MLLLQIEWSCIITCVTTGQLSRYDPRATPSDLRSAVCLWTQLKLNVLTSRNNE